MNSYAPRVLVEQSEDIVTLTLNRPEALNALDQAAVLALAEAIDGVHRSEGVRAVILRGAGPAFCGGGDVAAMHAHRNALPEFIDRLIDVFHESIVALARLQAPVIACVHGAVAGGGMSLALGCDLVVAEQSTRFVIAYPKLATSSDGGLSFRLTQRLGGPRALELLTRSTPLGAAEAYELGLVNRLAPDGEGAAQAQRWALELAALPGEAMSELKGLVAAQGIDALQRQLAREKSAFLRCAATAEFAQRVEAFATRTPTPAVASEAAS